MEAKQGEHREKVLSLTAIPVTCLYMENGKAYTSSLTKDGMLASAQREEQFTN